MSHVYLHIVCPQPPFLSGFALIFSQQELKGCFWQELSHLSPDIRIKHQRACTPSASRDITESPLIGRAQSTCLPACSWSTNTEGLNDSHQRPHSRYWTQRTRLQRVDSQLSLDCQLIRKHENATPDGWSMKISLPELSPAQQSSLRPPGLLRRQIRSNLVWKKLIGTSDQMCSPRLPIPVSAAAGGKTNPIYLAW